MFLFYFCLIFLFTILYNFLFFFLYVFLFRFIYFLPSFPSYFFSSLAVFFFCLSCFLVRLSFLHTFFLRFFLVIFIFSFFLFVVFYSLPISFFLVHLYHFFSKSNRFFLFMRWCWKVVSASPLLMFYQMTKHQKFAVNEVLFGVQQRIIQHNFVYIATFLLISFFLLPSLSFFFFFL